MRKIVFDIPVLATGLYTIWSGEIIQHIRQVGDFSVALTWINAEGWIAVPLDQVVPVGDRDVTASYWAVIASIVWVLIPAGAFVYVVLA